MNAPSELARFTSGQADWSPTARLDEHRPKNLSKLARFSVPGAAWISPNVRAHADSFSAGWTVGATCDLREVHGATAAVVFRRWRDAMFEGPLGQSPGRTKFAEPSNDRAVRFIQCWSKKGAIHFLCPLLVCRLPRAQGLTRLIHPILACAFGEQRKSTSPYAPHPCFGGRKRCQSGL